MARKGKRRVRYITKRVARAAASGARRVGRAGRNIAKEHKEDLIQMGTGLVVGIAEGATEASRVKAGKPAKFQLGGDPKDPSNKPHAVSVGDIAAAGGALVSLASKNKSTARLGANVGAAGLTLSGRSRAYDYVINKKESK